MFLYSYQIDMSSTETQKRCYNMTNLALMVLVDGLSPTSLWSMNIWCWSHDIADFTLSICFFSCLSGSDYRVDTRFGGDTETRVCLHSHSDTWEQLQRVGYWIFFVSVWLAGSVFMQDFLRWCCVIDNVSDS